ncbi:hypothetical protein BH09MYX1_BH09MYX1_34520 [soil metagenome]
MRRALVFILASVVACSRGEPPSYHSEGVSESIAPLPAPPPRVGAKELDAAIDVATAPPVDPGTLPQTHDRPKAEGAEFEARVHALWDGIVNDDPERAMPFFFPKSAYEQTKGIVNPASDWKYRLVANYKRDVHAANAQLGRRATAAKLIAIDVPDTRARWVEPGEEGNKTGYYRVYGTKLRYEVDGEPRVLDVTSLISWRGEWYLVHFAGFK